MWTCSVCNSDVSPVTNEYCSCVLTAPWATPYRKQPVGAITGCFPASPMGERAIRLIHRKWRNRCRCPHRCDSGSTGLSLHLAFVNNTAHILACASLCHSIGISRVHTPETLGSRWWAPFCARFILIFFNNSTYIHIFPYSFDLYTFPACSVPSQKLCSWLSKINQGHLHDYGVGVWWPHL